jgi:DNA-binding NtrC family response regulator
MTILIVDDSEALRHSLVRQLARRVPYTSILTAPSYAEAMLILGRCSEVGLSAVITDYDLGSGPLNGAKLLGWAPSGCLRVLMSGGAVPSEALVDADHFFTKPFDVEALFLVLGV